MAEPPQKKRKLPALPDAFSTETLATDSPDFHQGRTRAVPHAKGQWAAHVYLELEPTDSLRRALAKAESLAKRHTSATVHSLFTSPSSDTPTEAPESESAAQLNDSSDGRLHVSLSRPLLLQTSQRLELRTAVAAVARATTGFPVRFASFGVLENDERTRRFLGIEIGNGYAELKSLVHHLDLVLTKMRLPPYYDQPRFHTSLLWSTATSATADTVESTTPISDSSEKVADAATSTTKEDPPPACEAAPPRTSLPFSDATVAALEAQLGRALREDEFYVAEVCLKIGKEVRRFPLVG